MATWWLFAIDINIQWELPLWVHALPSQSYQNLTCQSRNKSNFRRIEKQSKNLICCRFASFLLLNPPVDCDFSVKFHWECYYSLISNP